jgi:hypothetical protein
MHWTPIDGTTLLHLAIDFDDEDIFQFLLAHGADVNARANVFVSGSEGFGGHTPIYNAVVSHGKHQGSMAGGLLNPEHRQPCVHRCESSWIGVKHPVGMRRAT